jgi:hypothetical protein
VLGTRLPDKAVSSARSGLAGGLTAPIKEDTNAGATTTTAI